jgi:HSP20 family protein
MEEMDTKFEAELTAKKNNLPSGEEGHLTVDVFRDGDSVVVQSTIAGTDPKDIDISITHDMITIRGHRKSENEVRTADYYHQELYWGSFSRSIILPTDVDPDRAKASYKNGVLTIRMPKASKGSGKK